MCYSGSMAEHHLADAFRQKPKKPDKGRKAKESFCKTGETLGQDRSGSKTNPLFSFCNVLKKQGSELTDTKIFFLPNTETHLKRENAQRAVKTQITQNARKQVIEQVLVMFVLHGHRAKREPRTGVLYKM